MCDYSLYTTPNRIAEEGEELVLHRFETGTLGFASVSDLVEQERACAKREPDSFWDTIKTWLSPQRCTARIPAVCVPPGSSLMLDHVPARVQKSLFMAASEVVVFTEISSRAYSYRDALLLPNGTRVLLQDLPEGIHAFVLSTSPEPDKQAVRAHVYAA